MSHQLENIFHALEKSKKVQIETIMKDTHQKVEQISRDMANNIEREEKEYYEKHTAQQIEYFKRQLVRRQKMWYKKYNEKRFALVKNVLNSVRQRIQELSQQPNYKEILQTLIKEIEVYLDMDYRIHGRPVDDKYLKELDLPGTYELILDRNETGILIEIPAKGLIIENSLESRLRQQESQLIVEIAAILFERMEASPWEIPQVMAMLMRESTE